MNEAFRSRREPAGVIGKLFGSLICLCFIAVSVFLFVTIAKEWRTKLAVRSWKPVQSTITRSAGIHDGSRSAPYRFVVEHSYTFEDKAFRGSRYSIPDETARDYAKIQRLINQYRVGETVTAWVNPANPAESVLKQPGLSSIFGVLFLLPFFLGGAFGLYLIWKSGPERNEVEESLHEPDKRKTKRPLGCLVGFFSIFLLVGIWVFIFTFIKPLWQSYAAANWVEVPCVVVSSDVRAHRGNKGTTYSVDILYEYVVGGKTYRANRYNFITGSSGGSKGKREIVSRYPEGMRTVCLVNPAEPTDAVLTRNLGRGLWIGLVPLIFTVVGAGGIYFSLRSPRNRRHREEQSPPSMSFSGSTATTVPLKGRSSPLGSFIMAVIMAGFWNGIISVFARDIFHSWRGSSSDWFSALFLAPFAVVGLVLLFAIFYTFVALFSPRFHLRVNSQVLPQGAPLHVEWTVTGATDRINRLELFLEGVEEEEHGKGKRLKKEPFCSIPVAQIGGPLGDQSGKAVVTIPTDKPPSSDDSEEKIVWRLRLKAKVDLLPNVSNDYPLKVVQAA